MDQSIEDLLAESRALLYGAPKLIYSKRSNVMFQIMTCREERLFPSIHLWEPDSAFLRKAVYSTEPDLAEGEESYYIAIHGHEHTTQCGGKDKWTQLCHMAYFIPTGAEKDAFYKKWSKLYEHGAVGNSIPPASDYRNQTGIQNSSREGRMGLGEVDFSF